MRISLAQWIIQDWQGPTTGVRFRIAANNNFTARDDDNTGVEIDTSPNSYREVDCVVGTAVIEGVTVKTITIPPFWLFSTNDAIVPIRNATYRASFVTKSGREIQKLQLLQNFQLPKELEAVFNPVPWHEVLRVNYPAAPVPLDKETFSKEQILDLIGGGTVLKGGNAASPRVAFWSGPITIDGATGFEYQNADQMVRVVQQNASWNVQRLVENAGAANLKVGGNPALFSTHVVNEAGLSQRAIINDAATRRWTEVVKDSAFGLQYSAYDNSNVLQSNTIFDPAGGIGFSDSSAEFGYFYKASSAYHLGISASVGASGASKEITFTTAGVGVNKPTAIGSQLHVVSGATGRIGFQVDTAPSPSQPIAVFRNDTGVRFSFNHNAQATFGLASTVKGRLIFAVSANANTQAIEAADTPASNIVYKLPATDPSNGQLLRTVTFSGGVATLEWVNPTAGGDVSSDIGTVVDNKLARFQGTTGKLITDSAITVADTSGNFSVPNDWTVTSVGGAARILNAAAHSSTVPTGASAGPLFGFTAAAQTQSSGVVEILKILPTYNQTSTAGSTDISIARTHTAIGSGEHNFIKGFVGGVASFRINSVGNYFFGFTNSHIGDANGNELLRFDHVASAVNEFRITNAATGNSPKIEITGGDTNINMEVSAKGTGESRFLSNINIFKDSPALQLTDSVGGSGTDFWINRNGGFTVLGRISQSDLSLNNSSGEYTFGVIPQLPASDPTTGNQAVRKAYVDGRKAYFNLTWWVTDPSTFPLSDNSAVPIWSAPAGQTGMTFTRFGVMYSGGSHTSGGSVTFHFVANGGLSGHTVSLDNTNNTGLTTYVNNFSDITPVSNAWFQITARSGTVSERSVNVYVEGFQNLA